ncbi:hypothetical protein WQ54_08585 [Bacillus sp. SA1-12]|uniref:hypothetical protein n=1 Tax=Bacillus sp. SA1-12 TaxID=1455638 RepID=UPI0006269761|nr:hypothetical protein [Bacillus sp. SA1-12]KKI92657.1 hypothetical protein WQ54_08585 [Bacillus sp. SA1-12]
MPSIKQLKDQRHFLTHNQEFRCPECVDPEQDDFFCSPNHCPEQIPQPKFPSANSSFSPEELAEITECIEQANDILLTLGVERDPDNLRSLQQSLRLLRNQLVIVKINCGEEKLKLSGLFVDAGLDFIILETNVGNILIIPTERIILLEHPNPTGSMTGRDEELIDINSCLRRNLTFHFGAVVSKSPFLLNLFFGLKLSLFLESFVGCFVYAKAENEKMEKDGLLVNVNHRRIEVKVDGEKQGIDFDELCFLEIEQEKLAKSLFLFNETPIIT